MEDDDTEDVTDDVDESLPILVVIGFLVILGRWVVVVVGFLLTNGLTVVGGGGFSYGVVVSTVWNVENFGGSTVDGFTELSFLIVVNSDGVVVLILTVVELFIIFLTVVSSIASSLCSKGESLREMFLIAFSSVVNLNKALVG